MTPSRKSVLFPIVFGFTALPALLFFVASQPHSSQGNPMPQALVLTIAGISIIGACAVAFARLKAGTPWSAFKSSVIIALALTENCAMFGFVNQLMGGGTMLPYAGATWAVIGMLIVPRLLMYQPEDGQPR